ncbi:aspartate/methionine/tyrosine aminotransferase [Litoreibacter halocynthiae]|uniref:aspartate transaminase n=1 Tax=Litoreibacter halocynthiae TaxID=1242689 RepID=A0A4R7LSG6_9RHOB|nr:aminotransferase [Litoreibacter halocynthiae]TDT77762.1 aspartate/methionine/tyrosine aminotransferase [Litoreibacter halocynthiae]
MRLNPNMAATFPPPVMEARRWIDGVEFPADRPLINVSQAAPVDPPPAPLREAMSKFVLEDDGTHLYGPVLGLPELRAEVASQWTAAYGGEVAAEQVAITSGCNQAFASMIATLCAAGDEVIIPTPWYFNHKMWLDMGGISSVALKAGAGLLPSVDEAAKLITSKTRAITLVSPNNPGGVEYPSDLLGAFYDLCEAHGIALIVDETYRDFDSRSGAPHDLFTRQNWDETLIQLYSFSKAYRLTGHRVGAMVASVARLAEAEKFLDTVTICPNQLGQRAALWGMQNLAAWLGEQRAEILARRAAIEKHFPKLAAKGWTLQGNGAYFAYMTHPFDEPSNELAQRMVRDIGVLCLPGTMFVPEGDPSGATSLRIAFANIDADGIAELFTRMETL